MRMRLVLVLSVFLLFGCDTPQDLSSIDLVEPQHPGKQIYDDYCFSCHTPGLSGAPKIGDREAWKFRLAQGKQVLLDSTINGIQPAMPPRGVCFDCSDQELELAIDYILLRSQ